MTGRSKGGRCDSKLPNSWTLEGCIDKARGLVAGRPGRAAGRFLGCWFPGYPGGSGFPPRPQHQLLSGLSRNSLAVGGEAFEELRPHRPKQTAFSFPQAPANGDHGSLYMPSPCSTTRANCCRHRRKLNPPTPSDTVFGAGNGSQAPGCAGHRTGNIGQLCCWEHLQPLPSTPCTACTKQVHIAAGPHQFATLQATPWARSKRRRLPGLCTEGQCCVLAPCGVTLPGDDRPAGGTGIRPHSSGRRRFRPGYMLDAQPMCEPLPKIRTVFLCGTRPRQPLPPGQVIADPVGHYSRRMSPRLPTESPPQPRDAEFSRKAVQKQERPTFEEADAPGTQPP